MRADFRRRVAASLADRVLGQALDRNADRRTSTWQARLAGDPEMEAMRGRAQRIRTQTLADLPALLARFTERLERAGFHVHHVESATAACELVLSIARDQSADLVAKSKSMLTEEIKLNRSLEAAGLRVVETDLGEFIVQLRGEAPAHIITPAVHLLREQVASTFEVELGMHYSTDVAAMTEAARQALREVFLTAKVGVSGVNFGVVESGSLCILTNEGNGRMVTTLPPVHIAVMGLERIVPTLDDLALMLRLLPPAATGQRATSYVSLINSPRRTGDRDGPLERHLILVDNGRSIVAHGPMAESLLCIRCGACLNVCPVFREIGGHTYGTVYPGPIGSVLSPALFGPPFGHLASASTLCGACREVCPVNLDLPKLLLRTRAEYLPSLGDRWIRTGLRAFSWIARSPVRYRAALWFGAVLSRLLPRRSGWLCWGPAPLLHWTRMRDFPAFARKPFRARWRAQPPVDKPNRLREASREPSHAPATVRDEPLVDRFARSLKDVGAEFLHCSGAELESRVIEFLSERAISNLLVEGGGGVFRPKLHRGLRAAGIRLVDAGVGITGANGQPDRLAELDRVEAGLTTAAAGLAETGTVVLEAGGDRSQLASLLPGLHLVLLQAERIFPDLEAWITSEAGQAIEGTQALCLVTGPSRTADIEMTLTVGVHGPREVVVFCVE